jgi:DNA primase
MTLPEGFLDELKGRIGLPEVIGKTVKLARRGRQFLGLCPFHGEKTPSFHVYDDHYHCFGCGAHGSVIDFVMQAEKLSFPQAVERLAAQAGMTLPSANREEMERERRRGSLYDVLEAAAAYYQKLLRMPEGKPALDYLRLRGVGEAAIDRFRLGYAPEGRFAIKAALAREGFPESAMIEAGLLVQPEDESRGAYDRFRGRLMFPIADRRGRVVGFGGRILGAGEPKYLNSPETPLFHKGRLLYNLADGSKAARDKGIVIVVEGYMDVIGLTEAGWENVVAPLGTALTEEQLHTLWRLAPEPVLLFDPDAAGERAALRAAERALPLLKPGFGLRFATLLASAGEDPDTVSRKGYSKQLLHRTFMEAAPLSDFLVILEARQRRLEKAEHFAALEQGLRHYAERITDATARREFQRAFRALVRHIAVNRKQSLWGGRSAFTTFRAKSTNFGSQRNLQNLAERTLLAIVINHPGFFQEVEDELGSLAFTDPALDRLRQELVQVLSGGSAGDADGVAAALVARGLEEESQRLLDDPLIRAHRRIVRGAPLTDVREAWKQNADVARQLATCAHAPAQPAAPKEAGALARLVHRRGALGDGTD